MFVFGGLEALFLLAMVIVIFFQFRSKLAILIEKVFNELAEQDCSTCGPLYLGWVFLGLAIVGIAAAWKVRTFRYAVFGYLLPVLGAVAAMIIAASIYFGVKWPGLYLEAGCFLAFAAFCSFFKIERCPARG